MYPEDEYQPEFDDDMYDDIDIDDDDDDMIYADDGYDEDDYDFDDDDDPYDEYAYDEEAEGPEDEYSELFGIGRRKKKRRAREKRRRMMKVRRARRKTRAANTAGKYVLRKDFDNTIKQLTREDLRNASGIKSLTTAARRTNKRVSSVAKVNAMQSRRIAQMRQQSRMDGALEFAKAYDPSSGEIDLLPIISGVIKTNMLGTPSGWLANPVVIGAIGLALKQDSDGNTLLGRILGREV